MKINGSKITIGPLNVKIQSLTINNPERKSSFKDVNSYYDETLIRVKLKGTVSYSLKKSDLFDPGICWKKKKDWYLRLWKHTVLYLLGTWHWPGYSELDSQV